jgi:hypothetical protein
MVNIFSARFECSFTCFPSVSSLDIYFSTRYECIFRTSFRLLLIAMIKTLKSMGSFAVLMFLTICVFALTGHIFPTRFELDFISVPLVSSVISYLFHSFRVWFSGMTFFGGRFQFSTADFTSMADSPTCELPDCDIPRSDQSSPLVSSVFSHLLHSFRVYFHIFSTRFECGFSGIILIPFPWRV